jgi:hypothetical protein
VLGNTHEIDIVVEREVGVNHDNPERINWYLYFYSQKGLEDVGQLSDDSLTIKEVTTSRNLNRSIGEHLDRLGTVIVMICESNLVVKGCGFQLPFKTTITFGTCASQLERTYFFENTAKFLNINILDEARDHSDCRNLYPGRSYLLRKFFHKLIKSEKI